LAHAIRRQNGLGPILNVGLFPEEGKYNRTACIRCFKQYSQIQKDEFHSRCPECRGQIKTGVADRVNQLANRAETLHPPDRPPYVHLIPLAEIIAMALGYKSASTAGVQRIWEELTFDHTEIEVLLEVELGEIKADPNVIEAISLFRSGEVLLLPGGGGKYGEIRLPHLKSENKEHSAKQRSLFDY
jgi:uncharacterized protein (TIGR00375 family)